ncbi:MAG: hypothetical protein GC193_01650 [Cryomorphaceae bacterium]|nr:hypothetical protein [Cryomorphaceae bacterium]
MKMKLLIPTLFITILFSCGSQPAAEETIAPEIVTEAEVVPTTEEVNEVIEESMQKVDSTAAALEKVLNDLN